MHVYLLGNNRSDKLEWIFEAVGFLHVYIQVAWITMVDIHSAGDCHFQVNLAITIHMDS